MPYSVYTMNGCQSWSSPYQIFSLLLFSFSVKQFWSDQNSNESSLTSKRKMFGKDVVTSTFTGNAHNKLPDYCYLAVHFSGMLILLKDKM